MAGIERLMSKFCLHKESLSLHSWLTFLAQGVSMALFPSSGHQFRSRGPMLGRATPMDLARTPSHRFHTQREDSPTQTLKREHLGEGSVEGSTWGKGGLRKTQEKKKLYTGEASRVPVPAMSLKALGMGKEGATHSVWLKAAEQGF